MLRPSALICCFVLSAVPIGASNAQIDSVLLIDSHQSHWYLGFGAGSALLKPEGESAGFVAEENSGTGSKIIFGQRFAPKWSWEAGYLDPGAVKLTNPNPALLAAVPNPEIEYTVTSAFANYYLKDNSARLNWFAKLGVASLSTQVSSNRISVVQENSTKVAFGLGAQWRFGSRWLLRVEHDNYSKDATYTGLSIGFKFGDTWHNHVPIVKKKKRKLIPVVIEYPLYIPEEQAVALREDQTTVLDVADEITQVSNQLKNEALKESADHRKAQHLAKQAELLTDSSVRIGIVEESILRFNDDGFDINDPNTFVNDKGQKLLATPAEQSAELKVVRKNIGQVERSVSDIPLAQERLRRVRGRIAVVEESLLFIPPWEEAEAEKFCNDMSVLEKHVRFRPESTRLTEESFKILNDIAEKMNQNQRIILEVHAHTDSWGTYSFNKELSDRRAQQAVDYLITKGIAPARLVGVGYGEAKPLDTNSTPEGRAKNRRLEFLIKNPNICGGPESAEAIAFLSN